MIPSEMVVELLPFLGMELSGGLWRFSTTPPLLALGELAEILNDAGHRMMSAESRRAALEEILTLQPGSRSGSAADILNRHQRQSRRQDAFYIARR